VRSHDERQHLQILERVTPDGHDSGAAGIGPPGKTRARHRSIERQRKYKAGRVASGAIRAKVPIAIFGECHVRAPCELGCGQGRISS